MTFQLRTLRRAQRDVAAIVDWIGNVRQAPRGARDWLRAYQSAAQSIVDAPADCGLAPESDFVDGELRQFLFKTRRGRTYRAVFRIEDDEVLILRVRGPGQPPLAPDELD